MSDPRSDAPTREAVRERLQRDATWLRQHAEALDQRADAYTALSAIAADCEDAAGLLRPTPDEWQPIETAPKDTLVLVALIRDGQVWRVSDAKFNGLGWYTRSGEACHWRTHWTPLPPVAAGSPLTGERRQEEHEEKNADTRVDGEC